MEFKVIVEDDETITDGEREEFADQLREFVHSSWLGQNSATVIGPMVE